MAATPGRLVFVLTMVAWLAASIHTGSSSSGWWGSKEALQLRQAARRFSLQGNFDQAERAYRHGAELAVLHRDARARAWFLAGSGDAGLIQRHYRAALAAYLDAQRAAEQARDPLVLGAVEADLASLYQQMGDFDSALRAAEQARVMTAGLASVYYRPQVLLLLGRLRDDASSIPLYREGIQAARNASAKDPTFATVEANGWDSLIEALLARGDLDGADAGAQQAIALRQSKAPQELGYPEWLLAEVRIRQAEKATDPMIGGTLLDQAESLSAAAARARRGMPAYALAAQRGRILLLRGREQEGLQALEQAINQAQRWRSGIVAAPGSLDGAAVRLQTTLFDRFIQEAASFGIETGQPRWIAESFEAAEMNRAINLRDNALSSRGRTLSADYWEVLEQLQAEQTRLSHASSMASPLSDRLRLKLAELEARSGLGYSPNFTENFPSQASLIHFQASLKDSELLLSMSMGAQASFLWAVTRDALHVYRLPPAEQIVSTVRAFRYAVEASAAETQGIGEAEVEGRKATVRVAGDGVAGDGVAGNGIRGHKTPGASAADLGSRLYAMLFGQLAPEEASKPAWQLSVDDILLEVPFAALVPEHERRSGRAVFLTEKHSLEVKAGALVPGSGARAPAGGFVGTGGFVGAGGFVGIGDPVYNTADSRWIGARAKTAMSWFSLPSVLAESAEMNRLPGTGREVETSARAWQANGEPATLLEGAEATRARFLEALSHAPRIIHLATHAVAPRSADGDEGDLVFSLTRDRRPEMLSTSEIRTLHVPGSLVVMTGCDTAPSDAPAGLGLAGLVRAWIIAGASAVIATEWPVQDAAGNSLLASFYSHLARNPDGSVAEALRLAQLETMRSQNANVSSWAAYQVFTGLAGSRSDAP